MKYIIIGLGNFGSSLAQKLTEKGNEVIGVDIKMDKVEALKDKITHAICLDSTDINAVSNLPLKDTDIVIVAIGEDKGALIMATALMKQLKVKRLISRAVSPLQEMVLEAIGVDEIIHPEEETAERWAKKLNKQVVIDSFELTGHHSVVEIVVPKKYEGKTLREIDLRKKYKIMVLTTMKVIEVTNALGATKKTTQVQGVAGSETVLNKDDVMVLYGNNSDIKELIQKNKAE
jgi:trk system potassium uptake protein TrkA